MDKLFFEFSKQEKLWKHMFKYSLIPLGNEDEYKNKRVLLKQIEEKVKAGRYSPELLGFLSSPKSPYVARFIPLFSYSDYSTYFACVKSMEENLAQCSVEGTFGGWSMGGKNRELEEERAKKIFNPNTEVEEFYAEESMSSSSFEPCEWQKQWNQYWLLLSALATESDEKTCFVMFDIANFYDAIDLNQLEKKLRSCCPDHAYVIEILFHLLSTWNRKLNKYARSTKGLPQDLMGDFSRHLSHFYLSEFDAQMKNLCDEFDAKFIRYADDMVVMAPTSSVGRYLLFKACELLHSLGLNVNTTKVNFMNSVEFDIHWGFSVMNNFEQGNDELGLLLLAKNWKNGDYVRKDTALRRAISKVSKSDFPRARKEWVYNKAFSKDGFILKLKPGQINSLILLHEDHQEAARKIAEVILGEQFTEPKAVLLNFLHKFGGDEELNLGGLVHEVLEEIRKLGNPLLNMSINNSGPLQKILNSSKPSESAISLLNLKPFIIPESTSVPSELKVDDN